jgi:hypothetical protein
LKRIIESLHCWPAGTEIVCGLDANQVLAPRAGTIGGIELRRVREGRFVFADGNKFFDRSGATTVETAEIRGGVTQMWLKRQRCILLLVNFIPGSEINSHLSIFGRIDTLANEQYSEVFGFPALGRAAYGGMKVRF